MCLKHRLILATPLLGAGLVLGGAEAAPATTVSAPAGAVADYFSQRTDNPSPEPDIETQYHRGYSEGYGVAAKDATSCTIHSRRFNGPPNYLLGWGAGYIARYSVACPKASKPEFRFVCGAGLLQGQIVGALQGPPRRGGRLRQPGLAFGAHRGPHVTDRTGGRGLLRVREPAGVSASDRTDKASHRLVALRGLR
ncbi:hypothetical protein GCM10023195_03270 [Actinoallomurus liliacearum]|uniref:Uncharacterized protein n=1 Tax=Actinoallomurus liliacearum TaxID=1080073 RepID=A0ABP8TCS0_9ACTN